MVFPESSSNITQPFGTVMSPGKKYLISPLGPTRIPGLVVFIVMSVPVVLAEPELGWSR